MLFGPGSRTHSHGSAILDSGIVVGWAGREETAVEECSRKGVGFKSVNRVEQSVSVVVGNNAEWSGCNEYSRGYPECISLSLLSLLS